MAMHMCKLFLLGLLCIALVLSSVGATSKDAGEACIGGPCQDCGRRCLVWGFMKGG
ncbi:hypothetical protein RYX36_029461, partial [Vicia faba]